MTSSTQFTVTVLMTTELFLEQFPIRAKFIYRNNVILRKLNPDDLTYNTHFG